MYKNYVVDAKIIEIEKLIYILQKIFFLLFFVLIKAIYVIGVLFVVKITKTKKTRSNNSNFFYINNKNLIYIQGHKKWH